LFAAMMFRLPALSCVLVAALAGPGLAQPRPAAPAPADELAAFDQDLQSLFVRGGLTADQAAGRAHTVSPTVHRRIAELEASLVSKLNADLQQVPALRASASYERLSFIAPFAIAVPSLGLDLQIPFLQNVYDTQATLTVNLSDYVLRYPKLISAAKLSAEASRLNKLAAEVAAGQDARLAYYEWLRAQLQVLIARRQLAQVRATLVQEKALLDVQRVSRADYLRIESQAAEAEQTLDQLQNVASLREEQLRIYIGAPTGEQLSIGEDIREELAPPVQTTLDELTHRADQKRLDIKQIDAGIVAKDKQREADKAVGYPRLSAFGTIEDADPNPRVFPQADVFKFTWLVGIQLSWQLSDSLNAYTNEKARAAEAAELRADRENLVNSARIDVLNAQQAVQLALLSLRTSQTGLAAAEESYRVRKELLSAERATAVELVDAETDLTRARINALNARVDLRVALAELAHATGDDTTGVK
jgi:outer membrane protein